MSLIISYFNLLCDNCTHPEKSHLPLSQQPPSKSWSTVEPPFFKFIWRLNPSPPPCPAERVGCTLCKTDTDKLRLESKIKLLLTAHPELLNLRVALYFLCNPNHPLKFDWQTSRQERQADQKASMLVVVTHLKHVIYNIN